LDSYSSLAATLIVSAVSGKDASCQLLQSTCCHEYPLGLQFPGWRLSPLGPPRCVSCPGVREHFSEHQTVTTTSDSRCRHLRPWMATHLTARLPAVATFSASNGSKGSQSSWVQLAATLSAGCESGDVTSDAPCRTLRFSHFGKQPARREPGPLLPLTRQRQSFPEPRAPSIAKSL
jgi:hypothetical protein